MRSLGGLNRRPVLLFPDGVVSVVPGSKDLISNLGSNLSDSAEHGTAAIYGHYEIAKIVKT